MRDADVAMDLMEKCESLTAELATVKAEYAKLQARIAALEAQLTACTAKHYGQMAEEAKKHSGGQGRKSRFKLCVRCLSAGVAGSCLYPGGAAYIVIGGCEDTCTGFAERPQTQGVSGD